MPGLTDWEKRPRVGDWWQRVQARESFRTAFAFRPPENS